MLSPQEQAYKMITERYCSFSTESWAALSAALRYEEFAASADLVAMDTHSGTLFFLLEGGVRAYYLKDGREVTDWFAFEGQFVCAISSFYYGVPSPHALQAMGPTRVLRTERADIDRLCQEYHDIERLGHMSTTETMLLLQERVVSLQFASARDRYESLLRQYPDIALRAPVHAIASFLGITQETLSRIRSAKRLRI
ncbi:MAG: Crp/Fnr family transcriptional regulator [Bacteroidota bacterium]